MRAALYYFLFHLFPPPFLRSFVWFLCLLHIMHFLCILYHKAKENAKFTGGRRLNKKGLCAPLWPLWPSGRRVFPFPEAEAVKCPL